MPRTLFSTLGWSIYDFTLDYQFILKKRCCSIHFYVTSIYLLLLWETGTENLLTAGPFVDHSGFLVNFFSKF